MKQIQKWFDQNKKICPVSACKQKRDQSIDKNKSRQVCFFSHKSRSISCDSFPIKDDNANGQIGQVGSIVTRWLSYYFNIGPFRTIKFAKVSSQFRQILKSQSIKYQNLLKIMPKYRNFAKSGHTGRKVDREIFKR